MFFKRLFFWSQPSSFYLATSRYPLPALASRSGLAAIVAIHHRLSHYLADLIHEFYLRINWTYDLEK